MSSPKRERRSRSPATEKRMPQLVSTRRDYPDFHKRGRYMGSRPRRPYGGPRRPRGRTIYRAFSERYYPDHGRFDGSRRPSGSHHRYSRSRSKGRSHSRSRGRSYSRSRSQSRSHSHSRHRSHSGSPGRGHRRQSRSSSSRSSSSRSRRHSKHPRSNEKAGNVKLSHLKHDGSKSPDKDSPMKKKSRRNASMSEDHSSPHREAEDFEKGLKDRDDSYHREKSNQRSKEGRQESPQASSSKQSMTGTGKQLIARNKLHNIFTLISHDEPFELEEDISIAIQRNPYAEPSEESTVRKVFDEELFSMIRNMHEGQKPIFDREEIKMFGHDSNLADDPDFERRVIRLKPGKASLEAEAAQSSFTHRFESAHKLTRKIERDTQRSRSRSSRSRSKTPSRQHEPEVRLKLTSDPRYEARYAELQSKESSSSRKLNPGDLRHEIKGGSSKPAGDLRNRLEKRDETPWLFMKDDARDVKSESRRDKDLPDFSRRKDKYQYAEWMDKPEMIPKNPSYYEHDTRDQRDSGRGFGRGRGRGFRGRIIYHRPYSRPYRGRGTFRGRGRGNSGPDRRSPPPHSRGRFEESKRIEGEWKHDKFAELEAGDAKTHREDDQHPHSTSER